MNFLDGMSKKKKIFWCITGSIFLLLLLCAGKIVENNEAGWIHVKQGILGKIQVIQTPGPYLQLFGKITPYKKSRMIFFSADKKDGGKENTAVVVRFNGNGTGEVSGTATLLYPKDEEFIKNIHNEKSSEEAVLYLVEQHAYEAIKTAASVFKAGEVYAARKTEFINLAENMLKNGIYKTKSEEIVKTDIIDKTRKLTEKIVKVVLDPDTEKPIIIKDSPLKRFGITITQFSIKDITFDPDTEQKLKEERQVEQDRKLQRAKADTARQKAITEKEEGAARVAKQKADSEVEKMKEVVQAEKVKEVAEIKAAQKVEVAKLEKQARIQKGQEELEMAKLNKQSKEQEALGIKSMADAESYRAQKMKKAGLTPLQEAQIVKETKIGVMQAAASAQGPKVVIIGGSGSGKGDSSVESLLKTYGAKVALDLVDASEKQMKK